jgi:hypothetical protein
MAKMICTMSALSVFFVFYAGSGQLIAQENGHYLQGITGLENGSTAPPGVYLSYLPYLNFVDSFRKSDGSPFSI